MEPTNFPWRIPIIPDFKFGINEDCNINDSIKYITINKWFYESLYTWIRDYTMKNGFKPVIAICTHKMLATAQYDTDTLRSIDKEQNQEKRNVMWKPIHETNALLESLEGHMITTLCGVALYTRSYYVNESRDHPLWILLCVPNIQINIDNLETRESWRIRYDKHIKESREKWLKDNPIPP